MKVALYIRLSKEDMEKIKEGDDSESIKNQRLMLSEYSMKMNWQIYDFYVDEDISGAGEYRPEFERLLKDAKNREFDIVLCKSQSRFTRDMVEVEDIIHSKFLEWGIRFIGITDNADTAVPGNKKSRQINGLVNEWYLEDLSNNIRSTYRSKMEDGQFLGAFAPYGYKKDPQDKHKFVIDEEAAKVVRLIFQLYLQGKGTQAIAKILTGKGIPKPTFYKKSKGYKFNVPNLSKYAAWGHTTINRILKNPVYIGTLTQGKETTVSYKNRKRISVSPDKWVVKKNTHEPIISSNDFYKVQELLKSKRKVKRHQDETHIFATKVKCLHCGGTMVRYSTVSRKNKNIKYMYLRCKNNLLSPEICKFKNRITYDELYKVVEAEFNDIINLYMANPEAVDSTKKMISRIDYADEIKQEEKKIKEIDYKILEKKRTLTSLYEDKAKKIVDEESYMAISSTILDEIAQFELTKKNVAQDIKRLKILEEQRVDKEEVLKKYIESNKKLTHEIVVECIDYIEIGAESGDGERDINIHWKL